MLKIRKHYTPYFFKTLFLLLVLLTSFTFAQTRSKIVGTTIDAETGEVLYGVNVMLNGTTLGAASDENGKFIIINVPIGTYEVKASMIGYNSQTFTDVLVSADRVTKLDFQLSSSILQGEHVVVVAKRNVLHKEVSNTQLVITEDQINNTAGIRDINSFLEKQPGVTSTNGFLEIRGGSADQTGYFY